MAIASETAHSSLAQRIARVRNCMLVEVSTGVSVTDKELFVSVCQAYEQNGEEESSTLHHASTYRTATISDLEQEGIWRQLCENEQSQDAILWRLRHSYEVTGFEDSDWRDWPGQ